MCEVLSQITFARNGFSGLMSSRLFVPKCLKVPASRWSEGGSMQDMHAVVIHISSKVQMLALPAILDMHSNVWQAQAGLMKSSQYSPQLSSRPSHYKDWEVCTGSSIPLAIPFALHMPSTIPSPEAPAYRQTPPTPLITARRPDANPVPSI